MLTMSLILIGRSEVPTCESVLAIQTIYKALVLQVATTFDYMHRLYITRPHHMHIQEVVENAHIKVSLLAHLPTQWRCWRNNKTSLYTTHSTKCSWTAHQWLEWSLQSLPTSVCTGWLFYLLRPNPLSDRGIKPKVYIHFNFYRLVLSHYYFPLWP